LRGSALRMPRTRFAASTIKRYQLDAINIAPSYDMSVYTSLIAFSAAAGLLTIAPGLDTALVLRTAATLGTAITDINQE
jgi:hypothetical protein